MFSDLKDNRNALIIEDSTVEVFALLMIEIELLFFFVIASSNSTI